ncbi:MULTISPECIES: hypothetical protein [Streptomyces]|uniref:Uncharacterized protein n=1 Tax=Streptomyces griseosporeus TaxID=1910 RepID=A0ABV3L074_STRGS|nr:hypothetical protein [Streptomyces actuosus]MBM4825005.1 hypothetical protein [Streptomyces actuosus]
MGTGNEQSPNSKTEETSRLKIEHVHRIATFIVGLTGIAGFVAFVTLSLLYDEFYENFGILPSDVGLDYSQTLFRSWGFIVLAAISLTLTSVLVFAAFSLFRRRNRRKLKKVKGVGQVEGAGKLEERERRFSRILRWQAIAMTVAILVEIAVVGGWLGVRKIDQRIEQRRVKGQLGGEVDPIRFLNLLVMDISAHEVKSLTRTSDGREIPELAKRKLLYLGTNEGVYVLYDVENGCIVKLSAGGSVLRLKASGF